MSRVKPSKVKVLPAPIGGWNARDSLAAMPDTDAVVLENIFPSATNVALRKGEGDWADTLPGMVKSLVQWSGTAGAELFACTDAGAFDITASGTVGAAAVAITEGYVSHVNFNTLGGSYLILVNGVDKEQLYDGAAWVSVDAASTPAITNVLTTNLVFVTVFKRRVWYIEKASMSLWYLPTGQLGGAAVEFEVGQLFKRGGKLIALTSWTIDGGEGVDDYFVIASSEGELAVYKGTDPASTSTWALVGIYYIGEPLNSRCFVNYGGDLLFLCRAGVFPLSKVLVNAPTLSPLSLADKIQTAFTSAISAGGDVEGWQMCVYPRASALLVNIPIITDTRWDQYVQNLTTSAWCSFTGWNGYCMAVFDKELYLGKADTVTKIWAGDSDLSSTQITGTCYQAFSSLGSFGSNKQVKLMQPFMQVGGNFYLSVGTSVDYNLDEEFNLEYTSVSAGAVWDTDLWDTGLWGQESTPYQNWYTPPYRLGQAVSVKLRFASNVSAISWTATKLVYEAGGLL